MEEAWILGQCFTAPSLLELTADQYTQTYVSIYIDGENGLGLKFYDALSPPTYDKHVVQWIPYDFPPNETGVGYNDWHRLTTVVEFVDGIGPSVDGLYEGNDVGKVYLNGSPIWQGSTWEPYYYFDTESFGDNKTVAINSAIFRSSGTAARDLLGKGILFNNVEVSAPGI